VSDEKFFALTLSGILLFVVFSIDRCDRERQRQGLERDLACIQKAGVPCDQIAKRCAP
jgi:hypothetical protein